MAFSPSCPSSAKGYDLATYCITQLAAIVSTSQVNSDLLLDIATLDAVLDTVVAANGC